MTQLALFELADCEPCHSPPRSGHLTVYHTADGRTLLVFHNGHSLPPSVELRAEDRAWLRAALVNPYTER